LIVYRIVELHGFLEVEVTVQEFVVHGKDTISIEFISNFKIHMHAPFPCFVILCFRYSYKCNFKRVPYATVLNTGFHPVLNLYSGRPGHFCASSCLFRACARGHLPSLPLIRLVVLERESTCPLVRTGLPAYPAIAAGKQNAPQSNCRKESRA
jgi:hypothetical protein